MNFLVIDTNVIISALIKDGLIRKILTNSNVNFIFPEYGLNEIYSYKSEIINKANIEDNEFDILLLRLFKYIRLVPFDIIYKFKIESDNIMDNIYKEDSVFIATALAFNCLIWSDDKHFKKQNVVKVLTTRDIINILSKFKKWSSL